MKQLFSVCLIIFCSMKLTAQDVHLTRNGKISFFSHTNIEDIDAVNNEVTSTINTKTGAMQFLVLIKSFQFKKASMQQHFNDDDYMNSSVYPKADFKGTIKDMSKIDFSKDGSYPVVVDGNLTMHGVTNKVMVKGIITVKGGKISSSSKFAIKLADYKVSVPSIVSDKVAEVVDVTVTCTYEPYKS
jgi:polyisoprenoid-binding protein YceI